MKKVYKYKLNPYNGMTLLNMPKGSITLKVETQGGLTCKEEPCIWVIFQVENEFNLEQRILTTYGTGQEIPDPAQYHGTYFLDDGRFVGHVWEQKL